MALPNERDLSRLVKELAERPAWLLDGDTIEWDVRAAANHDDYALRCCVWSENKWMDGLVAEGHIAGQVVRVYSYTRKHDALIGVVDQTMRMVLGSLFEHVNVDAWLLPLASDALQDDGALGVLVDALLEAGHITAHRPPSYMPDEDKASWSRDSLARTATAYARHIMAPRIFSGWPTDAWALAMQCRTPSGRFMERYIQARALYEVDAITSSQYLGLLDLPLEDGLA